MKQIFCLKTCILVAILFSSLKSDNRNLYIEKYHPEFYYPREFTPEESPNPYHAKTAAYWTKPTMSITDAYNLSHHDIVIVDLENQFNNYRNLQALKKLNPTLKIIAYSNPMEIFITKYTTRPWQNQIIDEILNNRPKWILTTISMENGNLTKNYATFWPGMIMLNLSDKCPKEKWNTYSQWLSAKLVSDILSDPIWDGYFMDNGTPNISWVHPGIIDINGDSKADADQVVNKSWNRGMISYLKSINSALKDNKIIILNKGDTNYNQYTDGKFFEKFPNEYLGDTWANGWRQCLYNAQKTGNYTIFQVSRKDLMFGLASALLLDNVYLAISQDDAGIFPELINLELGPALDKFSKEGAIYTRKFEKGQVRVEPLNRKGEIIYY